MPLRKKIKKALGMRTTPSPVPVDREEMITRFLDLCDDPRSVAAHDHKYFLLTNAMKKTGITNDDIRNITNGTLTVAIANADYKPEKFRTLRRSAEELSRITKNLEMRFQCDTGAATLQQFRLEELTADAEERKILDDTSLNQLGNELSMIAGRLDRVLERAEAGQSPLCKDSLDLTYSRDTFTKEAVAKGHTLVDFRLTARDRKRVPDLRDPKLGTETWLLINPDIRADIPHPQRGGQEMMERWFALGNSTAFREEQGNLLHGMQLAALAKRKAGCCELHKAYHNVDPEEEARSLPDFGTRERPWQQTPLFDPPWLGAYLKRQREERPQGLRPSADQRGLSRHPGMQNLKESPARTVEHQSQSHRHHSSQQAQPSSSRDRAAPSSSSQRPPPPPRRNSPPHHPISRRPMAPVKETTSSSRSTSHRTQTQARDPPPTSHRTQTQAQARDPPPTSTSAHSYRVPTTQGEDWPLRNTTTTAAVNRDYMTKTSTVPSRKPVPPPPPPPRAPAAAQPAKDKDTSRGLRSFFGLRRSKHSEPPTPTESRPSGSSSRPSGSTSRTTPGSAADPRRRPPPGQQSKGPQAGWRYG